MMSAWFDREETNRTRTIHVTCNAPVNGAGIRGKFQMARRSNVTARQTMPIHICGTDP